MADNSLSSAFPLQGVCGIADCGDKNCIVALTSVGLSYDNDGNAVDCSDLGVIRVNENWIGPTFLEDVLHEWLHIRFPDFNEDAIILLAKQICALLYLPEIKRRSFG